MKHLLWSTFSYGPSSSTLIFYIIMIPTSGVTQRLNIVQSDKTDDKAYTNWNAGDGASGSQDEASSNDGKITTASAQEGY